MKRTIKWMATLCSLLLLCACGQTPEELPVETPPVVEIQSQPQGILTDAGQAKTLQAYYDRTAIIGRNEWMEGSFTRTEDWAREYAALEYPGRSVSVQYDNGYALPDAMTKDHLSGGVALWKVIDQQADPASAGKAIQIFYFTDMSDGVQKQYLSGLLSGEQVLDSKPEAYAYLALDTRFAARMQTLPDLTAPENATVQELNFFEDAAHPRQSQVWMLNPSVAVILSSYRENTLEQGNYLLTAYNLDTGVTDWTIRDLDGIWNFDNREEGVLTFRQYLREGDGETIQVWMEDDQPCWDRFTVQESTAYYSVGGYQLTWQDGSILLGEEVLLAATVEEEEQENEVELALYNFHQPLGDHRFLFSKAGWEWIDYYGVYDLETRQAHPLVSDQQAWGFAILQVNREATMALAACTEGGYWNLTMIDLENFTMEPVVPALAEQEDRGDMVMVNDALSRIAVLKSDMENGGQEQIRVYDTATGSELFAWDVPDGLVAGDCQLQLVGEDTLAVHLRQWKTDTDWLYRIVY